VFHRRDGFDFVGNSKPPRSATNDQLQLLLHGEKCKHRVSGVCRLDFAVCVYRDLRRMKLWNFHGAIEDAAEALTILQFDKENIQGGGHSHSRISSFEMIWMRQSFQ
jgi:hypothetical protein